MSFIAAAMGLAELLGLYDQFLVPEYQRVYGWGEVEIKRLFSDIERAMQPGAPHFFLGTIYLAAAASARTAQIADGQQRMLTATIAYAVARDLATDATEAARMHGLIAAPADGGFRVVPRQSDADFLARWVQARGATLLPFTTPDAGATADAATAAEEPDLSESQENVVGNRDAICQILREMGEAGRQRLFRFLETEASLVVITAPTLEDARNAYASTQNRGLRQAETDKLKAELIGDCAHALRARLASHWEECEATLGKEDLAELFQHMIVVRAERKPQHAIEVDLFKAFSLPADVENFVLSELAPSARAFRRICEAQVGTSRAARRVAGHLITLQRVTHGLWKAPALLALRLHEEDVGALEALLAGLERLAASLMIRGTDPNLMLDRYIGVIREMKKGVPAGLAALELSDRERAQTLQVLKDTKFGQRERFRTPALLKLNDLLAGEVQAIPPKKVSCEHVLPRNTQLSSPWRALFRTADGRRYDGARYVNMLGNLALLSHADNQRADTHPFDFKRGICKRSEYALANDVARARAWTPEGVLARTTRLTELLAAHWRL